MREFLDVTDDYKTRLAMQISADNIVFSNEQKLQFEELLEKLSRWDYIVNNWISDKATLEAHLDAEIKRILWINLKTNTELIESFNKNWTTLFLTDIFSILLQYNLLFRSKGK